MKHKLLSRRFFVSLMLLAVSTLSWAYDFEVDGIYYYKNSDGTSLTVTYKNTDYNSYSGTVVIPSSVEYIEQNYTVTSIGTSAFWHCSGLTSVTIGSGVTSIGQSAFSGCSGLTTINIPEGVTSIGQYAFYGCSSLNSITISNSVTNIYKYAFADCSGLTAINIPNSVTSIGDLAFSGCSGLTSVTIPNSVTGIGSGAFFGCSGLKSITIPNSVTSIGQSAFSGCSGLTSVTCLAENVPNTGYYAFEDVPQSTATLYVPATSLDDYRLADQWTDFGNIVGINPTAVEELKSNKTLKANESAPIFDLMGRRLSKKPTSGYYIQGGKKYFVK